MRIVLIVFTFLFSLVALGVGGFLTWRDLQDGHRIGSAGSGIARLGVDTREDPKLTAQLAEASALGTKLDIGAVAAGIATALGLASVLTMFSSNRKLSRLLIALLVGTVAMVVINPSYDTGSGPADARTLALMSAVPMLFVAGAVHALRGRRIAAGLLIKKGGRTHPGEESLPSKMKERPCPGVSLS